MNAKATLFDRKTVVVIQARYGSTRFPGKVVAELIGQPMLAFLIRRLKLSKHVDQIILATTLNPEDSRLCEIASEHNIAFINGSEDDVLARFVDAALFTNADTVIRITADCPLVDPLLLDHMIEEFYSRDIDYMSNCDPPTYPDGLDIEIFTSDILLQAHASCNDSKLREHVTPWIRNNSRERSYNQTNPIDLSAFRWTVDEPDDFELIKYIVSYFEGRIDFLWQDVAKLAHQNPEAFKVNQKFHRNEGASLSKGQKLWRRAKRVIPGGNMLLSKRPELYLPERWPTYFHSAEGCSVTDLDGNKYTDMSLMGVGTNLLGYNHPEVNAAVQNAICLGNMSSLNCPEEVALAEKLVEIHPWADMARFARTGGEANAVAIRIARAATGRDAIAVCGYHGWHDWYLATNLSNQDNLSEHFLEGLSPTGVPKALNDTVQPFSYNNIDQLEQIASNYDLAAVKMEVQRSHKPNPDFLESVRRLCDRRGIVLIFDECTSGFRETYGGLHKKYGVDPDLSIFGKALGNGYAITAIIGRENIMDAAQSTFISSTFWTERIGPVAALACLDVMQREETWKTVTNTGTSIQKAWKEIAKRNKIRLTYFGIPALAGFAFDDYPLAFKTYISQEMLKKGFLASTIVYASTAHTQSILDSYYDALDNVFASIAHFDFGPEDDPTFLLETPLCHTGFKRLN